MNKMKLWMVAAILFSGVVGVTSCINKTKIEKEVESAARDMAMQAEAFTSVINNYLVASIGSHYTPGEVCIPVVLYQIDEVHNDSILVWGDYWVFNYNVVGDTLKCVSGGNHAGKMLLLKNVKGKYRVVSFEQVEDGHGNMESAKRIFGKYYDAFHKANSDENFREETRANAIADFITAKRLFVKYYQDYGWPAKKIPVDSVSTEK